MSSEFCTAHCTPSSILRCLGVRVWASWLGRTARIGKDACRDLTLDCPVPVVADARVHITY